MALEPDTLPPLIGEHPRFLEAVEQTSRLAGINRPVLVLGERGTGKELIAVRLHYLSPRWQGPLVKVNCAALTETLLDSELFGHEGGAFTGARGARSGRFERADGGSLFLDEVATMSPRLQEKLLRAIEYGEFERVGGGGVRRVDVRVIGAANIDLRVEVDAGRFRADLLDRLAFDVIAVPPLRQRGDDVILLAEHFAARAAREFGRSLFPGFGEAALAALRAHLWPGNVRELRNAVERSLFHVVAGEPIERLRLDPFAGAFAPLPAVLPEPPFKLDDWLAASERSLLARALERAGGHQGRAAESLELGYHQFRSRLRRHGLLAPGRRGAPGKE